MFVSDSVINWVSFGNLFVDVLKFYDDKWNVVFDVLGNVGLIGCFFDLYVDFYKMMLVGMNMVSYVELMSFFVMGKVVYIVYLGCVVEVLEVCNLDFVNKYGIFVFLDSVGK